MIPLIGQQRETGAGLSLAAMCRVLEVSRAAYYRARQPPAASRKVREPSHDDVLAHAWLTRCASAFRVIRVSGAQAGTVRSIRQ